MIQNFVKETKPLTPDELALLEIIVPHLSVKIGSSNAVTNATMCKGIKRTKGITVTSSRMRKIINHIRLKNIIPRLVATSRGYYIENDIRLLNEYIVSLEDRAKAILAVARALKNQKNSLANGEQNLFNNNHM